MCTFLDIRLKEERHWTGCWQAFSEIYLRLISSWMQFWFDSVVPKYVVLLACIVVGRYHHLFSVLCFCLLVKHLDKNTNIFVHFPICAMGYVSLNTYFRQLNGKAEHFLLAWKKLGICIFFTPRLSPCKAIGLKKVANLWLLISKNVFSIIKAINIFFTYLTCFEK
jgi:hypothetical protein